MHLILNGEKTNNIYEAFGRQPLSQYGSVGYSEFDDPSRSRQAWTAAGL
jgi:hypothetical protein